MQISYLSEIMPIEASILLWQWDRISRGKSSWIPRIRRSDGVGQITFRGFCAHLRSPLGRIHIETFSIRNRGIRRSRINITIISRRNTFNGRSDKEKKEKELILCDRSKRSLQISTNVENLAQEGKQTKEFQKKRNDPNQIQKYEHWEKNEAKEEHEKLV